MKRMIGQGGRQSRREKEIKKERDKERKKGAFVCEGNRKGKKKIMFMFA